MIDKQKESEEDLFFANEDVQKVLSERCQNRDFSKDVIFSSKDNVLTFEEFCKKMKTNEN